MPHEIQLLNGSLSLGAGLEAIANRLEEIFISPVRFARASLDLHTPYDSSRRQANSTLLLAQMLEGACPTGIKRIGIVDVDLFVPILTFVFGEAQLRGTAAIVSTHRLSNQFYGLSRNDELMLQRLQKELVHELGHTFGLYHCRQFECVMRASTAVEEIDLKHVYPCSACTALLSDQH